MTVCLHVLLRHQCPSLATHPMQADIRSMDLRTTRRTRRAPRVIQRDWIDRYGRARVGRGIRTLLRAGEA